MAPRPPAGAVFPGDELLRRDRGLRGLLPAALLMAALFAWALPLRVAGRQAALSTLPGPAAGRNLLGGYGDAALAAWGANQTAASLAAIAANARLPGAAKGALAASPSTADPDYAYHWTRDAALVMSAVAAAAPSRPHLVPILADWLTFEIKLQKTDAPAGLGEPKFNLNGTPYTLPWGRPQNDGPALRALAVLRTLRTLEAANLSLGIDPDLLYNPSMPAASLLKRDLEHAAREWRNPSFDAWEECRGYHYHTRRVQALALFEGALHAAKRGDGGAARWYLENSIGAERASREAWDWTHAAAPPGSLGVPSAAGEGNSRWLRAAVGTDGCIPWKVSQMDSQASLAHLHADPSWPAFLPPPSGVAYAHARHAPQVLDSLLALSRSFASLYTINAVVEDPATGLPLAPALGRYPEDRYTGTSVEEGGGNPWVLTTAGAAEVLYRLSLSADGIPAKAAGTLRALHAVATGTPPPEGEDPRAAAFRAGDAFLRRVWFHATPAARRSAGVPLSEQLDRDTGAMKGARELSWSHAAVVTAFMARERAEEALRGTAKARL
ncbi:Six-hairpin glycosidase-like protein [Hyaloraphidium curvatum]|nr:Six-hairpin glycosidase-like protein [Hyaloraphidium curvatum]